jgi:hypothetical protein
MNDKINFNETSTKSLFYVPRGLSAVLSNLNLYVPTSKGEVVKLFSDYKGELILSNESRPINENDNFNIFTDFMLTTPHRDFYLNTLLGSNYNAYLVRNGILFTKSDLKPGTWVNYDSMGGKTFAFYKASDDSINRSGFNEYDLAVINRVYYSSKFIKDYDIFMVFYQGNIYFINDFSQKLMQNKTWRIEMDFKNLGVSSIYWSRYLTIDHIINNEVFNPILIKENTSLENNPNGWDLEQQIVEFGINGNNYFELIPEFVSDQWVITPFLLGTYIAPNSTIVSLQPINR